MNNRYKFAFEVAEASLQYAREARKMAGPNDFELKVTIRMMETDSLDLLKSLAPIVGRRVGGNVQIIRN